MTNAVHISLRAQLGHCLPRPNDNSGRSHNLILPSHTATVVSHLGTEANHGWKTPMMAEGLPTEQCIQSKAASL